MANVNANINVNIQTQQAAAQLRRLSAEISNFNQQSFATNSAAAQQQRAINQALIDGVKASGQFRTSIIPMTSAVEGFSRSIEKSQLSLGQYTRYAASQLPGMRRVFTREFDMISRVAERRVKLINSQFIALGESANGMQRALSMTPVALDQFAARSAIALQRQQIFNRLLRDGSTQLLNWGKNTQWAGRQLMVGFTIPLGLLGAQAAKVFRELEAEAVNFKKVYGDMFTTDVEVEKNLAAIKELSIEMTKYGQTAQQTMQLANTAAQAGARGAELMAATTQATRLSVLGQMEQNQAIETTISLQTAFAMSNEQLAESINFLNSVENQTILSLQDVSEAIPRVASVIKGFGGDVEDLAVLLVAMKEGGVSAAEGSNALKNSLARVIAPTKQALDVSAKYGISLREIVARNEGQVVPLFQELAKVLDEIGGQPRQEILSAIFGKFQYARIGTLLSNIARDGSQAAKAIELTGMEARDLALTAEKELSAVEDAVSTKFTAALEKAKLALAPIGGEFLKALTPVLESVGKILDKFNQFPDGIKTAIVAATGIIGGIAPIILMITGLVANGIANIAKFILFLRKQLAIIRGNGDQFKYYSEAELQAAAAASSLEGKTSSLTKTMLLQRPAIETLITLYQRLATAAAAAAAAMPATMGGVRSPARLPRGGLPTIPQARNAGGPIFMSDGKTVPGSGNTDKVPAMLTPGEYVVNKQSTENNRGLLEAINSGQIVSKNKGGMIPGVQYLNPGAAVASSITSYRMGKHLFGKYSINKNMRTKLDFMRGAKWAGKGIYSAQNINETRPYKYGTMLGKMSSKAGDFLRFLGLERKMWKLTTPASKVLDMTAPIGVRANQLNYETRQVLPMFNVSRLESGMANALSKAGIPKSAMPKDLQGRTPESIREEFIDNVAMSFKGRMKNKPMRKRRAAAEDIWIKALRSSGVQVLKTGIPMNRVGLDPSSEYLYISRPSSMKRVRKREQKRIERSHKERWGALGNSKYFVANRGGFIPGYAAGGEIETPQGLTLNSPDIMKAWAKRRARRMQPSQSKIFTANDGNIVPGTGNTDTVPAMLTPGEFVINKAATQQNLPLIQAINNGNVAKLVKGGPPTAGPLPDIGNEKWVFAHGKDYVTLDKETAKAVRQQSESKKISGSTGTLRGYSNLGFMLPESANVPKGEKGMSPANVAKLFNDPKLTQRIMFPLYQQIARDLGRNVGDVMKDPKITKQVTEYSRRLGVEVGKITTATMSNESFYKAVQDTSKRGLNVVSPALKTMAGVTTIGTGERGGRGGRYALAMPLQKSIFGQTPTPSYKSNKALQPLRAPLGGMPAVSPAAASQYSGKTFAQSNPVQALAREIKANNPRLTSAQALNLARLQSKRGKGAQARNILALEKMAAGRGGGGGGRTPTFLGMPGMPDKPRQSMFSKMNSGIGKAGMGLGMGVSMMGMVPMMKQDEQGKFMGMDAGTAMMGMMGAGTVLSILPMLGKAALPVAAVGAAAGAVAFGLYKWRDSVDSAARETAEFGSNLGVSANALSNMSAILGMPDLLQSRQYQQLSILPGDTEAFASFSQMLSQEGGPGQKFIKELRTATSEERFSKLTDYLRSGIAAEMLSVKEAKLFANAVGVELGDVLLGIRAGAAVSNQEVGSGALMEIAKERESAALEQPEIIKTIESFARKSLDASEASMTVGAGTQIIKSFNEAIAKAQKDYEDGILSFTDLIDTVNSAESSIRYWEDGIKTAYTNVNDFGALLQGQNTALALAGITKEQQDALNDAYKQLYQGMGSTTTAGTQINFATEDGTRVAQLQTEGAFQKVADLAVKAGFDRNVQGVKAYVASDQFDREAYDDIVQYGKNLESLMKTDMLQVVTKQAVTERGIDPLEAVSIMNSIAGSETALQAFIDGGQTVDAFMNSIVEANAEIMFSSNKLQDSFTSLSGQLDKTGQSEAFRAYLSGAENDSERARRLREIESVGSGMDSQSALNVRSQYLATKTIAGQYYDPQTISAIQQSSAYQAALRTTQTQTRTLPKSGTQVSREVFDDRQLVGINQAISAAGEAGVSGEVVQYALDLSVTNGEDAANTIDLFTEKVQDLQGLDEEVRISLGIDLTTGTDVETFGGYAEEILRSWGMLSALNPNIDLNLVARSAILDEDGKPITDPTQVAKNIIGIEKAYSNLEKATGEKQEKAQIDLVKQYQTRTEVLNENGETVEVLNPEAIVNDANNTLKEIGKNIDNLPAAQASQVLQIQTALSDSLAAKRSEIYQLMADEKQAVINQDYEAASKISQQISAKQKEMASMEADAKANILTVGMQKGSGSSKGGGGKESPVKGFLEGILNQVKLYTDADAKMSDLNNAKSSFVDQVLKGEGIFDKLRNVKGMPASIFEQILGMGPEGAQEFLDKYVKGGKLTKAGRGILNASAAAGINQTIGMNVLGAETKRMQARAATRLKAGGASDEVIQTISGDPKQAAEYLRLQRAANNGVKGAKKDLKEYLRTQQEIVDATKEEEKARMSQRELISEGFNMINVQFDEQEFQIRQQYEKDFAEANGQTVKQMERQIESLDEQIKGHQDVVELKQEEIEKLDRANEMDQRRIESYNEMIQDQQDILDVKDRQNELDQREIDKLSRQDEIRQRTADALQHELDLMSETEDEIRQAYDKRLAALNEVSRINDHIINQQRQQIDLSRALSEGDVYAAAQAAEQMRSDSAQFAIDQTRAGLEQSMENEVAGLRTSQGLTRDQAEAQIANIKQQSYQTSLQIRDIEDRIYQRNLEMIPVQDEIYRIKNELIKPIEDQIAQRNLEIRDYNDQIYNINDQMISPLEKQRDAYSDILSNYERKLGYAIADMTVAGQTREEWEKIETATTNYLNKKDALDGVKGIWNDIVAAMREASRLAPGINVPNVPVPNKGKKSFAGGLIRYASGGYVSGPGGRDSVSAMLSPGEYVIKRSMVDKYGIPMLSKINQGSFDVPRYSFGAGMGQPVIANSNTISNITAPVYNTYDMNFNIQGADANAEEIANKVMMKIRNVESASIRRINGY